MAEPVLLRLLGPPELQVGGAPVPLAAERRSQLLVLLALRRGWVGRAEIAALLWPEQESRLAYANLRKALFRLPTLPWGRFVQTQGAALRFDGGTDVDAFEAALREQRLADALALRRGELLAGFDDPGNEAWTSWLGYERERHRAAWRAAALSWLEAGAATGAQAHALAAQLLEADPLDEAALRVQVRLLARSGQQAAARQLHGVFVQRLADELGLPPGAALTALLAELDGPSAAPPPPAAPNPILAGGGALDEGFIGRTGELRRVASLLEQADCRLLTVVGPGGIGKTRLARRALFELAPGFQHGGAFVSMEDVAGAEGIGQRLARELALEAGAGGGDALAPVVAALAARQQLLVLDNFETLVGHAALLSRLLQSCPGVKLLVTSRARLVVNGEWVLQLEGLPCPDLEDLDRLDAFDAVRLFTRGARQVRPDWTPQAEAAHVVEICRLVEGLPLALELAAAWVRLLPCADIAAELRRGGEVLRAADGRHAPRHASIEQVFEQSWQQLSEVERAVLARLSVFRGGCTASAARAVTGAPLAVLAALADKSLLHKDDARLRLHPLVQQLAAARLPEEARRGNDDAHAMHYLQMLAAARRAAHDGERETLLLLDAELDNARAAWAHAATTGAAATGDGAGGAAQAQLLEQAADTLVKHAGYRGRRQEGLAGARWGASSAAALRHPGLRAVLLAACADLQVVLGDLAASEADAAQALALAEAADHVDARVKALIAQVGRAIRQGRLDEARTRCEQAMALVEENPQTGAQPYFLLDNLAMVDMLQGRYDDALRHALAALQQHRSRSSPALQARSLNNIGNLQLVTGDVDGAEAHLREGLALCERHGIAGIHGLLLNNLSYVAEKRGDLDEATRLARRALVFLEQTGDRSNAAIAHHQLALMQLRRHDLAGACDELSACLREALDLGNPTTQLHGLVACADVLAADGAAAAAALLLDAVAAHPRADGPLHKEIAQRRAALPVADPQAWARSGLGLDDVARRVAREGAAAFRALKQALQPGA